MDSPAVVAHRQRCFFEVGGFNPLLSGPEDIDLLRRIALRYDIAGTAGLVAFIGIGVEGSTTDYKRHAQQSRHSREAILELGSVFSRLQPEATSAFWHGRLVRLYVTSLVWNLRHGRLLAAVSRGGYVARAMLLTRRRLLAGDFWRSLCRPYESPTFSRALRHLVT
jgi:hypothetical protein